MSILFSLLVGAVGGFIVRSLAMKVEFKQRTIENKIKVFDALIGHWVFMRNIIYDTPGCDVHKNPKFDQVYGESQRYIGQAILVCENVNLLEEINALNENFYRPQWGKMSHEEVNEQIEKNKLSGIAIATRMREDIKNSTRIDWKDLTHIFTGFFKKINVT